MRGYLHQALGTALSAALISLSWQSAAQVPMAPPPPDAVGDSAAAVAQSTTETIKIPADTRILMATKEELIGKKGAISEGQRVRAEVWKDVVVDGRVVIAKGTNAVVKVDFFKRNKIAGRKGKITLGAYEVETVDGTPVELTGGYYKQGTGRIALTATLTFLTFLPLIFIKGGKAKLPKGTVFDAFTGQTASAVVQKKAPPPASTPIDVLEQDLVTAGLVRPAAAEGAPPVDIEFLYEELEGVEKPKAFPITITAPRGTSAAFEVSHVNAEVPKKAVPVEAIEQQSCGPWTCEYSASIPIKSLVKTFQPGLNTVRVAAKGQPELASGDVLVELEI